MAFHSLAASALLVAAFTVVTPRLAAAQTAAANPSEPSDPPSSATAPAPAGPAGIVITPNATAEGVAAPQQAAAATRRDPTLGVLRVVVLDESGAAILGSQVIVRNTTGVDRTVVTNERGEAVVENLPPGKYTLLIDSPGFDPLEVPEQNVRRGQTNKEVTLAIAGFVEQLDVTRDKTDERMADTFATGLSKEEIDQLPDDPDEMQAVLEQMAGPGASMFVNGFSGGRLPPKSQIQNIRFRFDPYSADNHDAGRPRIDIATRPGAGEWKNNMTFTFRDEALNGRYAMGGAEKLPEQSRRGFWTIEGPLVKGKTSFALSVSGFDSFDSQTIQATLADGARLNDAVQQPAKRMNVDGRVEHALNKNHTLRITFERSTNDQRNLGVGQTDLPERAYARNRENTEFRISESGLFGRYRNDIRVEYQDTRVDSSSSSSDITMNVQDSFRSGGAQIFGGARAREFEISDDLDFAVGKKHAVRIGARVEGGTYSSDETRNTAGTYTFRTLDDFNANRPIQFTRRFVDNPLVEYTNWQSGFYVTDDYKVRKNIMLSMGLRYETQSILNDWNNFAPRVSATWSPFKSNRTTFRGGYGVFYDWYDGGMYEQTLQLDGVRQYDEIYQNPSFPEPPSSDALRRPPASIVREAANLEMPTIQRFSVGADHQLISWLRLRTNYFEQRGSNELRALNANYPVNGVRPDTNLANVSEIQSIGKSESRGVDLGLNLMLPQRRIFAFLNYTLAKAENDGNGITLSPTNLLSTEWGYSSQDVRHRLFAMFNMPLPKGFRSQTTMRFQSGPRYNITTGEDDNQDGVLNERNAGTARNSGRGANQFAMDLRLGWTLTFGPPRTPVGPGGGGPQIRMGGPGGGGGGRGGGGGGPMMMGGGPGGDDKRYSIEIFAQANNVLNSTIYTAYAGTLTSSQFGLPLAAQPPRRIEIGTRLGF